MNKSDEKRFAQVAKLLSTQVVSKLAEEFSVEGFVTGVLLVQEHPEGKAFCLLYEDKYGDNTSIRGMTGFINNGAMYNFDQRGISDSWYPHDFKGKMSAAEIVKEMQEQVENGARRLKAFVERQAFGIKINFGPTARTLLPTEIAKYKELVSNGASFSLNPSGMGTGYRFYSSRTARARYGQGMPASAEARKALDAPYLVYDTTNHD